MQQPATKRVNFSRLVQEGQYEEAKQLFFDDASWTITSPIVNVAHRLFDEARRNRPDSSFTARVIPAEAMDGDYVPLTISREQAVVRRVQRAIANRRSFGNNNYRGIKPF